MRIDVEQVVQIKNVLTHYFSDNKFDLFLYGSRVHDHLKGGDIDLLILTEFSVVKIFEDKKFDILVDIKKQPLIGQRRIDLKAVTQEQIEQQPFLKLIWKDCIKL